MDCAYQLAEKWTDLPPELLTEDEALCDELNEAEVGVTGVLLDSVDGEEKLCKGWRCWWLAEEWDCDDDDDEWWAWLACISAFTVALCCIWRAYKHSWRVPRVVWLVAFKIRRSGSVLLVPCPMKQSQTHIRLTWIPFKCQIGIKSWIHDNDIIFNFNLKLEIDQ